MYYVLQRKKLTFEPSFTHKIELWDLLLRRQCAKVECVHEVILDVEVVTFHDFDLARTPFHPVREVVLEVPFELVKVQRSRHQDQFHSPRVLTTQLKKTSKGNVSCHYIS